MTSKINYYTSKNYNKTESNGEGRVKEYLDKNKIDYDLQVSFSGHNKYSFPEPDSQT